MNAVVTTPPDVMAELQDLAAKLGAANDACVAADVTADAALSTARSSWKQQAELARQLYAQMRATGVDPAAFTLNGYAFTPDGDSGSYLLRALPPSIATVLGGTP